SSRANNPTPALPQPPRPELDCETGRATAVTLMLAVAVSLPGVGSSWLLEIRACRSALPVALAVKVALPLAVAPAASDSSMQVMLPVLTLQLLPPNVALEAVTPSGSETVNTTVSASASELVVAVSVVLKAVPAALEPGASRLTPRSTS